MPKRLLWRLTIINIVIVASFIVLSSWAIYNTACFLADGLVRMNNQKQAQFDSTLFQYLWIFSISTIVIGSLIHFNLTKKMMQPLKELMESTRKMKQGHYPRPLATKTEDEIGQLIGHFNELVQQLKENQDNRRKVVSDLSHEFRTPLSNLNGYLNALSNGVIEGDQKLYRSLHNETKRLISMVEQLEELKEWDYLSKQKFSEKEPVDMQLLIAQSLELFRWSLLKAGIKVDVKVESGIVNVNNGGIQQVLGNLIDNAIRYNRGIEPIKIKGENTKSEYMLSVTNSGQPIPLEEQDQIFERFYRVDPSRSQHSGGTGLGLAISKEIVEHHDGKIGIRTEGNHHTFWFTLPLSP
jgi:two-component system sensor histidine kinase BaeS